MITKVRRYNEWIKEEKLQGIVSRSPKKNKRGANVGFQIVQKLTDATMRFDDREGTFNIKFYDIVNFFNLSNTEEKNETVKIRGQLEVMSMLDHRVIYF